MDPEDVPWQRSRLPCFDVTCCGQSAPLLGRTSSPGGRFIGSERNRVPEPDEGGLDLSCSDLGPLKHLVGAL